MINEHNEIEAKLAEHAAIAEAAVVPISAAAVPAIAGLSAELGFAVVAAGGAVIATFVTVLTIALPLLQTDRTSQRMKVMAASLPMIPA